MIFNSSKVSSFKIYVGFDSNILKREFDYNKRYFIIEIYSSGTAPIKDTHLSLYKSLNYIHKMGGIVFAISQQEGKNGTTMDVYESSIALKELNVIPLKNMIWESSIVKLMGASNIFDNNQDIINYMLANVSGEICD
jgi:L-asparaginase/Glu-tRNA(Gln) amidotransferase subunit D